MRYPGITIAVVVLLAAEWVQGAGYEGFGATTGGDKSPIVQVTSLADKGP